MSQENVEIVRQLYPAEGVDIVAMVEDAETAKSALGPLFHPDFEATIDPQAIAVGGVNRTVSGIDGFISGWRDWTTAFEAYRIKAQEFMALNDGRVLVLDSHRAKSQTGGVEMEFRAAGIWTVTEGLVRQLEMFMERGRALEAAGLSESGG
jgi:ketosteroid isomerase-like protein